ncbi:ferritin-like domain-containing protein [Bacteroides sp. 519]|uniref:ferritin-like domain-containing protein n=1 Tax=Bacteroides sp. 519 TaxID=2302937 RepID=UPI0013CFCFA5|nr:ferritin-like domain-containing protein [Bacteroides sp. 519]NDV59595.1 bacterioferritin [Bacteroides sp. 519]
MIKRERSIELLNKAVSEELTAVHQYMYFHFRLDDMGYDFLSNQFKRIAIVEMMHVERLAERILFLKGEVEMVTSAHVEKIHDVEGMLKKAEQMETDSIDHYNQWARECAELADSATKAVFEQLVIEEENHQDQFDTEIDNMDNFGDNYLALQSIERSKNVAMGSKGADKA